MTASLGTLFVVPLTGTGPRRSVARPPLPAVREAVVSTCAGRSDRRHRRDVRRHLSSATSLPGGCSAAGAARWVSRVVSARWRTRRVSAPDNGASPRLEGRRVRTRLLPVDDGLVGRSARVLAGSPRPRRLVAWSILLAGGLAAWAHGRFWRWKFCKTACPIGLYYTFVSPAKWYGVYFRNQQSSCIECNLCDHVCPVDLAPRELLKPIPARARRIDRRGSRPQPLPGMWRLRSGLRMDHRGPGRRAGAAVARALPGPPANRGARPGGTAIPAARNAAVAIMDRKCPQLTRDPFRPIVKPSVLFSPAFVRTSQGDGVDGSRNS